MNTTALWIQQALIPFVVEGLIEMHQMA